MLLLWLATAARSGDAPPAGWPTFTDPVSGFSVRYPPGWVVRLAVDNPDAPPDGGIARRSVGFFGPHSQMVFVDVWPNPARRTPADWLTAHPPPSAAEIPPPPERQSLRVDGRPAVQWTVAPPDGASGVPWHVYTFFAGDGRMFGVEYAALQPDFSLYRAMLATLRLAPPAASPADFALTTDLPPADYGIQTATCCGYTDPEYNPFPCNTTGDASCPAPPCGNCTWWVRYRRTGDTVVNLVRCTGDALTWGDCAAAYYPALLSDLPGAEAVVLYGGIDHLSFVEQLYSETTYGGSDLSWYASCPARYFSDGAGGGKSYILHPYRQAPNQPPNPPLPESPADDAWLASREVTFVWRDGGDPDDGPSPSRDFLALVEGDSGWNAHSGWLDTTSWQTTLPADGEYTWRVKAHDGSLESNWSERRRLRVDSTPPVITLTAASPAERWYNTDQPFAWTVADPDPGIGLDAVRWAWDDPTPDTTIAAAQGTTTLAAAGQGMHTLYLRAADALGNESPLRAWGWFGYDTRPPAVEWLADAPPARRWYSDTLALPWRIADPAPGSGGQVLWWDWDAWPPAHSSAGQTGEVSLPPAQGWHTLYAQAIDAAGNVGAAQNLGRFGYDSLPPAPPVIGVDCGAPNNRPQNFCRTPVFTWAAADAPGGSGVVAYAYTWSLTPTFRAGAWSTATTFRPEPVAPPGGAAKWYLHVRARDAAGNISPPATFALWYDAAVTATVTASPEPFGVRLNDGAHYTALPTVTVVARAPNVAEVRLRPAPAPSLEGWQPVPLTATWVLTPAAFTAPRRMTAWFRDAAGTVYGPYARAILFDPHPPRGRVLRTGAQNGAATLALFAWDDNSGLAAMRVGAWGVVTRTAWQRFTVTVTRPYSGGVLYAQFRDRAGNVSPIYGTDGSDSSLTQRLYLPLVRHR